MAIADFTKAIEINPTDIDSLNYRGQAFYHKTQYASAIADFNSALAVKPDYFKPAYNLARSYARLNNAEEACIWLKKSIENGFKEWDFIKKDKDLDNIRELPCYKEVMAGSSK